MPNLSLSVFLNAYGDRTPSNNPSQNFFKWNRSLNSLSVDNPTSLEFSLAPGESKTLFNGSRTLTQDGTTQYSIAPVVGKTSTYQLTWVGGTAPQFRTSRVSGANATTQVTVTQNGPVTTFTSTGGTLFSLIAGGVIVGDFVRIGTLFNALNQGERQIIARTATSFSVANADGAAEGPITLGAGFAAQIDIYSAIGVQAGDILQISGGFSLVTQGSYVITSVSDIFVQFSSTATLPTETVTTQAISIYSNAKTFIYLESDNTCSLIVNGNAIGNIQPFPVNACCSANSGSSNFSTPGIFMLSSVVYSLTITNNGTSSANLFLAAAE